MDSEVEVSSPCDDVVCAFGDCQTVDGLAYCNCPDDYHRVGYIHCVPNNADGDVDDEADGDPDVDLTDAATEKVTRTFSHNMDAGNSSLRPGETRVTAGSTGYGSQYPNYDVNAEWLVYCTWDHNLVACDLAGGICWNYDLTESVDDCAHPALVGDTVFAVAWIDMMVNGTSTVRWALVQLDLRTLDLDMETDTYTDIQATEKYVIWSSSEWRITVFNRNTEEVFPIDLSLENKSYYPDVYGKYVVWQQQRPDDLWDIWFYDLGKKQGYALNTSQASMKCHPVISGQYVAFIDECVTAGHPEGTEKLIVYHFEDDTWETLLPETGPKDRPDIDRDKVVWTDLRRGGRSSGGEYVNPDVYLYNLTKKQEVPIAVLDGWQFYPRISGRWVVYADSRFDRQDDAPVKIYDLILFDLCSLELYKNEDWCR